MLSWLNAVTLLNIIRPIAHWADKACTRRQFTHIHIYNIYEMSCVAETGAGTSQGI